MPAIMMGADDRWENRRHATAGGALGFTLKSMHKEGLHGYINLAPDRSTRVVGKDAALAN